MIVFSRTNNRQFEGIAAAFASTFIGGCTLWEPENEPLWDMVAERKPTHVFIDKGYLHVDMNEAFGDSKVIIFNTMNPGVKADLRLIDSEFNLKLVPDGVKYYQLQDAANYAKYRGGVFHEEYEADIFYFHTQRMANEASRIIDDLYRLADAGYTVRVVGYPIAAPFYMGYADLYQVMSMAQSSKIALDYGDSMIREYGASNIFCLGDTKTYARMRRDDDISKNIVERVASYVENKSGMSKVAQEIQDQAIESTCYQQAADIGKLLEPNWKEAIETRFKRVRR